MVDGIIKLRKQRPLKDYGVIFIEMDFLQFGAILNAIFIKLMLFAR